MANKTTWQQMLDTIQANQHSFSELKDWVQEAVQSFLTPDEHSASSLQETARQSSGGLLGPNRNGNLQLIDTKERNEKIMTILESILTAESVEDLEINNIIKLIETNFGELNRSERAKLEIAINERLREELESLREGDSDLKEPTTHRDGANVIPFPKK